MMGNILRGLSVLLAVGLIIGAFIGSEGLADEATQNAMLPPCTVEEGLPFVQDDEVTCYWGCLLYTSPSPRDATLSRMPSSA